MANIFDQFDAPAKVPPASPMGPFPGMLEQGNIDLNARPIVKNADGSYSTVRSMSFGDNGGREILVPTVSPDGKIMSDGAAADLYGSTGQNLGKFDTPAHADMYAEALHKAQDQHYGAQAAQPAGNVFDQFDAPAATAPAAPTGNNIESLIRGTEKAPADQPSSVKDFLYSAAAGVPRGAVEYGMLPVTAARLVDQGGMALYDKLAGTTPEEQAQRAADDKNSYLGAFLQRMYDGQDAIRSKMDENLYAPRTTAGKYGRTVGEFLTPGSLAGRAGAAATTGREIVRNGVENAVGNVVLPALASEGAGQLAEGTPYEGAARFAGALAGNAGVAAGRSISAPESFIRRATTDMTPADWERALGLQGNRTGIALSGPESIAEARGGASALPDLLRVVEGSVEGRANTAPFFAQRPGQVDTAVTNVLDQIAPQHPQPSTLGPSAAQAAQKAISSTPQGQELLDAITGAGPRTTALDAGTAIQEPLRGIFDRREGMRAALGDKDYAAARKAAPTIPVDELAPETTTVRPAYTSIRPTAAEGEDVATSMTPVAVPAKTETPALTSRTGMNAIQADPRDVVKFIDDLAPTTKASAREALRQVRQSMFDKGGVDTSVTGLDATRHQIGDMINVAKQSGENHTAAVLQQVQERLDATLAAVPEYGLAKKNFAAASTPLAPFESPGMSKAIERDVHNKQFTTAPENVPAAISSPSEARNFNAVAPTEARVAFENHLATQILDKATDASGRVNADTLAVALRDNQDMLSQYPAVADRLQKIVGADANMAPARAGPIGQVAAATDTAGAGNALLPQNPLTGSGGEAGDAARRLVAEDPATTAGLVRQNIADRHTKASTETQGNSRDNAGTKFHKDVAGNDARREVLDAVLREVAPQAGVSMDDLLTVLHATGNRQAVGSRTAFNAAAQEALGAASPAAAAFAFAKSLGGSLINQAGDATKRAALRGNLGTLAEMFTDPHSVELIRQAVERGARPSFGNAALRSAAETGSTYYDPAGAR
ncbi:hypothetical protein LB543_04910 [Mesorhizobium sp. ESP7-2]|uniref:hypothetical protein n=1 Tax=Mesorhizobium sp. ESP7-2 TaxID=2876622 RepID=UPI001CC91B64|nr:hypothetical protein [Mesorhizobium sp. ESP7-2]MBZ9706059.1 hypothetical protein [Mesorhizobium sp. ESP7-2]